MGVPTQNKPSNVPAVAHKETGIHSIFSLPAVYAGFQNLVGAVNVRREFLRLLDVQPGQRVLDVGCGPGTLFEWLPKGTDYVGLDLNPLYIQKAEEQYGGRGRFICREFNSRFSMDEGQFDRIIAFGLVHHLGDDDAGHLFKTARSVLKPGGRFLTLDGCFTDEQSALARFIVKQDRGRAVRTPEGYLALARPHFRTVRTEIRDNLLRMPYTHIFIECIAD